MPVLPGGTPFALPRAQRTFSRGYKIPAGNAPWRWRQPGETGWTLPAVTRTFPPVDEVRASS
jgi:hypothetical protein